MWDYGGLHEKSLAVLELDIKTTTKKGSISTGGGCCDWQRSACKIASHHGTSSLVEEDTARVLSYPD